jgi:hypothetical protein
MAVFLVLFELCNNETLPWFDVYGSVHHDIIYENDQQDATL